MFPGFITGYLFLLVAFEFTLRKRKNRALRTIEYIFWGIFAVSITFIFLFSAWHFGGLEYIWDQIVMV